jgi:CRISPR-associated endonuclease/helicase Cas3
MEYYAHTRGESKAEWQSIKDHLIGTAGLARQLGTDSGLADFAVVAAMLHDLGKYSQAFQRRLEGAPQKVDHTTAGALEVKKLLPELVREVIGQMLAYCITGHHGGLMDAGSPVSTQEDHTLAGRLKRASMLEDYSAYSSDLDFTNLQIPTRFPSNFRPNSESPGFSLAFATRMIYSILVDADFLDTETFCNGGIKLRGSTVSIPELAASFTRFLERFSQPTRPIDARRSATLQACIEKAQFPTGLFTLTLPTGAGKTLTSMAFALQHALRHGLKRVIYVIPYTSIIEQNAAVFKNSLAGLEDVVLEHHSSFDWNPRMEDEQTNRQNSALNKLKWAAENWDIPIVVTTNVQFFESLFANRSSRNRKLHNIARSAIIFDEAQMLPREFMKPCLYSVAELVRNYGCSAVFCTATQPSLERFLPPDLCPMRELIPNPQAEFDFYRRVQVELLGRLDDASLLERLNNVAQVLCIVNTRKHAKALFAGLSEEGRLHLSTLMCGVHRRKVISEIRRRLSEGLPCRVVSTQLLEAGVDLDFPVGYRALAGLDSIIQAAGRVNRENLLPTANFYVFEPDSEHVRRMPRMIQQTAEVARLVVKQHSADPVSVAAIRDYYNLLYAQQDAKAFDSRGILADFRLGRNAVSFDFATAADKFKLIDEDTQAVIVPYDDTARRLLEELRRSPYPLSVARKLQPYTVNVYAKEFENLQSEGAIVQVAEIYPVLRDAPDAYDEQTGLVLPENVGGQAIFIDF